MKTTIEISSKDLDQLLIFTGAKSKKEAMIKNITKVLGLEPVLV